MTILRSGLLWTSCTCQLMIVVAGTLCSPQPSYAAEHGVAAAAVKAANANHEPIKTGLKYRMSGPFSDSR